MNEMEIYFARENALWNWSIIIYFIILIPVFYVIGAMIIDNIKINGENERRKKKMEDEEIIIQIFKDYIRQYEKSNTISVGMLPNGENVIYTKIKMTGKQKEFMKDYIERKEKKENGR